MTLSADPVLFVGGVPRSGTTLLRNMLSAHPMLAVPDESYFVREVYEELARRRAEEDLGLAWKLIREHRFFKQWGLDPAIVDVALQNSPPHDYPELIRRLFSTYAVQEGKPMTADKTPSHACCFDWLADRFPGSRFVHVLRDPREVCMSLAVQPWHRGGIEAAAEEWTTIVCCARAAGASLGDRFIEIRYENLVAQPGQELAGLCAFAGLPFDEEMLRYTSSRRLPEERHHAMSRQPPEIGVRTWTKELDSDDLALIELIDGPAMRQAGYPPAAAQIPLRIRFTRSRAWARRRVATRIRQGLEAQAVRERIS